MKPFKIKTQRAQIILFQIAKYKALKVLNLCLPCHLLRTRVCFCWKLTGLIRGTQDCILCRCTCVRWKKTTKNVKMNNYIFVSCVLSFCRFRAFLETGSPIFCFSALRINALEMMRNVLHGARNIQDIQVPVSQISTGTVRYKNAFLVFTMVNRQIIEEDSYFGTIWQSFICFSTRFC